MSGENVGEVMGGVKGVLRRAARATGAGFDYLFRTASRESGLNSTAKAQGSSAAGMFQFVEQTWLEMVKEEGAQYGLGDYANKISRTASGRYEVSDKAARSEILSLRYDPEAAANMAGAFAVRNRDYLTEKLGRTPTEGELYIAHFLGAKGASTLMSLAQNAPSASAAAYFPDAAAANRSIFYSRGRARSADEVYAQLVSKHGNAAIPATRLANVPLPVAAPDEDTALAYADTGPVFHNMFHSNRAGAVSNYVDKVWSNLAGQQGREAEETARSVRAAATSRPAPRMVFQASASQSTTPRASAAQASTTPLHLWSFLKPDALALPAASSASDG